MGQLFGCVDKDVTFNPKFKFAALVGERLRLNVDGTCYPSHDSSVIVVPYQFFSRPRVSPQTVGAYEEEWSRSDHSAAIAAGTEFTLRRVVLPALQAPQAIAEILSGPLKGRMAVLHLVFTDTDGIDLRVDTKHYALATAPNGDSEE
jgi:hypothetical protein